MLLIPDKLYRAMQDCTRSRADAWAGPLSEACARFQITTEPRLAAFIAQIGHETLGLSALVENLNYSEQRLREVCMDAAPGSRWRSLLPRAKELARQPVKLGEAAYGGRMGNRPEGSGDGYKFRGHGPVHTTGAENYRDLTERLHKLIPVVPDFTINPEQVEKPAWGAWAAAIFWDDNELNELADDGQIDRISRRVNGGSAGLVDRRKRWAHALRVLGS